jgi:hypothetical protein
MRDVPSTLESLLALSFVSRSFYSAIFFDQCILRDRCTGIGARTQIACHVGIPSSRRRDSGGVVAVGSSAIVIRTLHGKMAD